MKSSKEVILDLFESVDVAVNGVRPWDIKVIDERFYDMVISQGSLGLGESYIDGYWECDSLDQFFYKILRGKIETKVKTNFYTALYYLRSKLFNFQNRNKSIEVAQKHYDLGNDLYEKMLGPSMVYTCGYWKDTDDLSQAQINKMDLVCKKIGLKPGMKVLDIGCGFGSFMKYAAEKYGVSCVGLNLSKEQIAYGEKFCKGLPIKFEFADYREFNGKFDRIVSIGMFEAVGYKNFKDYMDMVSRCLIDDGIFLLHTIGNNKSVTAVEPWMDKYIFPNGMLPSIKQIGESIEGKFVVEDWHNFGPYYDKTLMAWFKRFDDEWVDLRNKYGDRFYRIWKYYLLSCAGSFRAREIQLWQIVMTKNGIEGGYNSVR